MERKIKMEVGYSALAGVMIPSLLLIWKNFGPDAFAFASAIVVIINVALYRPSISMGIISGSFAVFTELVAPSLGLWYYSHGYQFHAIFMGFCAIGTAASTYMHMMGWDEHIKSAYKKHRIFSNILMVPLCMMALCIDLFYVFWYSESQLLYVITLIATILLLQYLNRELWHAGAIYAVYGLAEEGIGVEMGLWGYEVMPGFSHFPTLGTFPFIVLFLEYFLIGSMVMLAFLEAEMQGSQKTAKARHAQKLSPSHTESLKKQA